MVAKMSVVTRVVLYLIVLALTTAAYIRVPDNLSIDMGDTDTRTTADAGGRRGMGFHCF